MITLRNRNVRGAWWLLALALPLACGSASGASDAAAEVREVALDAPGDTPDAAAADTAEAAGPDAAPAEPAEAAGPDAAAADTADDARPSGDAGGSTPDTHVAEAAEPDAPPPDLGEPAPLDAFEPQCSADADCADDDPCTLDTCTAGVCVRTVAADASPCDDGDPCTAGDTCLDGACVPGPDTLVLRSLGEGGCDDGNACTVDQCGPGAGCSHWPRTGSPCDDGDPCTGGDACLDGACQAGALNACPVCPDGACSAPYEGCADCPADCGACAEDCSTPGDEDQDGQADCADPECASTAACLPAACLGAIPLTCGDSRWGNPSVDHLNGYDACSSTAGGFGEDDVYAVTLPPGATTLAVTLDIDDTGGLIVDGDDLDLYVLQGACATSACVAAATSSSYTEYVSTSGAPGQVFYVVVELYSLGFWGYGDYTITIDCY